MSASSVHAPSFWRSPVVWPLAGIILLILANVAHDRSLAFLTVTIADGHLYGSLIDILNQGSRCMLVALGMRASRAGDDDDWMAEDEQPRGRRGGRSRGRRGDPDEYEDEPYGDMRVAGAPLGGPPQQLPAAPMAGPMGGPMTPGNGPMAGPPPMVGGGPGPHAPLPAAAGPPPSPSVP